MLNQGNQSWNPEYLQGAATSASLSPAPVHALLPQLIDTLQHLNQVAFGADTRLRCIGDRVFGCIPASPEPAEKEPDTLEGRLKSVLRALDYNLTSINSNIARIEGLA